MENTEERKLSSPDEILTEELSPYGKFLRKMKQTFGGKKGNDEQKRHKKVSYAKYGYLFLIPFFISFIIFQLVPLCQTFYYSFFEYHQEGIEMIQPSFIGWENYSTVFNSGVFFKYFGQTMLMWICGFVPQIIISLLLAIWFTDNRLKLKGAGFFKTVTYMPNLVMAAAFGLLFLMLFGHNGPINQMIIAMGGKQILFTDNTAWSRAIIAFIDWFMWFGNTAILLMSGVMGIDESIFESARLDGSGAQRTFWKITLPLLMPIVVFVLITSLIGGIQLFDVVQIFSQGKGGPSDNTTTVMMYLYITIVGPSKNYGLAGAISTILFLVTGVLSLFIFKTLVPNKNAIKAEARAYRARMRWLGDAAHDEKGGK